MLQPQIINMGQPARRFIEVTMAGDKPKKLYMPADCVQTYEFVPAGKNPAFEDASCFLRYDFGEGISYSLVTETLDELKNMIGTEGFVSLTLLDDAEVLLRDRMIIALQEREDTDSSLELTQVTITLSGQISSIYVKETIEEIKQKRNPQQ